MQNSRALKPKSMVFQKKVFREKKFCNSPIKKVVYYFIGIPIFKIEFIAISLDE